MRASPVPPCSPWRLEELNSAATFPVEAILSRIQVEKRIMNECRSHLLSLGLLHTKCQLSSFGKGVQMIADLLRRSQDPYA